MRRHPLIYALCVGLLVAACVLFTGVMVSAADQALTPLETARLEALAARQEVLRLQGALALAEQAHGVCAAARGQLELLVSKAVIDGKQAEFVRQYEADHPGFTWDFESKGPVKKDGR